jgi:HD-GYP domain-containing protein (c-di-GMP phosphodiesterase class II)
MHQRACLAPGEALCRVQRDDRIAPAIHPMLKKIPVDQVCLGMYLHGLEGPWLKHPFWKTRFVIDDLSVLQQLRTSGVAECWIDEGLGQAVAAPVAAQPLPPTHPADLRAAPAQPGPAKAPKVEMSAELDRAAAVCARARDKVSALFNEARMGRALDVDSCLPLVEEVTASVMRHPGALISLARLKTQDSYSYMHSVATCALMVALARQMGMDEAASRAAGVAGLMHDVGKAMMPLEVLTKPGRLSDSEFSLMRTHPECGHALLLEGRGATAETLDVVLHHHEKFNGEGYPHRLAGNDISLLSRMGAVCDVYDAITSNRPYKAGWDPAESLALMASWTGHFDKAVLAAFVRSLGIYPTGSLVRLASGRLAVVIEQNPSALVDPVLRVFYSTKSQMRIPPERLDLSRPGCSDRIVGRESNADYGFTGLDELWLDPDVLRRSRAG